MTWQDKTIYWAWRSDTPPTSPPPTEKRIAYAWINQGLPAETRMAVTVYDNGVPKEIHRVELEWNRHHGAVIKMPPEGVLPPPRSEGPKGCWTVPR